MKSPSTCSVCSATFSSKFNHKRHEKNVHGLLEEEKDDEELEMGQDDQELEQSDDDDNDDDEEMEEEEENMSDESDSDSGNEAWRGILSSALEEIEGITGENVFQEPKFSTLVSSLRSKMNELLYDAECIEDSELYKKIEVVNI